MFQDDVEFTPDAIEKFTEAVKRDKEHKYLVDDTEKPIYELGENLLPTDKITGYQKKEQIEMVADLPDNWDVFYFGAVAHFSTPHMGGNVYKVREAYLDHAVGYNKRIFQKFVDELKKMGVPCDAAMVKVYYGDRAENLSDHNAYYIKPGIAYQRAGYSNNDNAEVDIRTVD